MIIFVLVPGTNPTTFPQDQNLSSQIGQMFLHKYRGGGKSQYPYDGSYTTVVFIFGDCCFTDGILYLLVQGLKNQKTLKTDIKLKLRCEE